MLKRLEVLGFKSFANRAAFEFDQGISALVGPNGSGKSNVADAVRWVLGEQSARALRGKRADEVIFVGSAERRPLGMAEVALVLDNGAGRLPLDFAEVRVARRLYRSGESEYLLNGTRARRRDLVGLLLQVGLHAEGYTVIGQGAVEELVMQRPEERRAVLEHAADITRHQARLAEARAKLGAAQQNLTRSQDVVAELEPHARRLRGQAEKAERYAARRQDLAALAHTYYRATLTEQSARLAAAERSLASASATCQRIEASITAQEAARAEAREQLAALDADFAHLRAHLEQLHRGRDDLLAQLASDRQRVGFLEARREALLAELDRAAARIAELSKTTMTAEGTPGPDPEASRAQLARLEVVVDQLSGQLRQARQSLDAARAGQRALADQRDRLRERRAREREAMAEATARRSALESQLTERVAELARLEGVHATSKQRETQTSEALTAARHSREVASAATTQARREEQALQGDLQIARSTLAAVLDEARLELAPTATHRAVASLLVIPPHLEVAIAAALGEWARANVAESPEHAQSLLSGHRSGRALVAASIGDGPGDVQRIDRFAATATRALAGVPHHLAATALTCSAPISTHAPLGPLAFTVLVESLDLATVAAGRLAAACEDPWQVATLQGHVITHWGGWALGSESVADRLVSMRRREASARTRVEDLAQYLAAAAERRASLERELSDCEARERAAQAAHLAAEAETRSAARRAEELGAERRRLEDSLDGLRAPAVLAAAPSESTDLRDADDLARQAELLVAGEAAASETLHTLQPRWEEAWAERERARRDVEEVSARLRARGESLAANASALQRLRSERSRALEAAEHISREYSALIAAIEAREQEASTLATAISQAGAVLDRLAARRQDEVNSATRIDADTTGLRHRLDAAHAGRENALLARQQALDELSKLRGEAAAVAEEWGLDGDAVVQLRLEMRTSGSDQTAPGPSALSGSPFTHQTRVSTAPAVSDGVPQPAAPPGPEIDLEAVRRRMLSLQRELRSQGSTSELVLEEYREVNERLRFLEAQSADLRSAMLDLEGVIEELEGMMRRDFAAAFDRVNAVFEKTFATLFGGGTARLTLTDPGDPLQTGVDIVAQPPGKRLQTLMSLSGGERALTSTALIFALLAINPLPFCVLDEVDAALDEPNARRFAALLQDYAERTQFILITHNRATMEIARALYGISMGGDGVTTVISLRPGDALADGAASQVHDPRTFNGSESILQAG